MDARAGCTEIDARSLDGLFRSLSKNVSVAIKKAEQKETISVDQGQSFPTSQPFPSRQVRCRVKPILPVLFSQHRVKAYTPNALIVFNNAGMTRGTPSHLENRRRW